MCRICKDTPSSTSSQSRVLLAADKSVQHSIIKIQDDDDKITPLNDKQLLCSVAETSTRQNFMRLVKANVNYNYFRHGNDMTTKELASFTRNMVSDSLRSRSPMQVASLVAGVDEDGSTHLYLIEQLGSMQEVTRGALGYCSYFLYGLMDDCYKKDFSLDEGKLCIKKCIYELKTRFLINLVNFDVFLVSKDGYTDISGEFNNLQ